MSKANGNGVARVTKDVSSRGPKENIFLFWPNIIGESLSADIKSQANTAQDTFESS